MRQTLHIKTSLNASGTLAFPDLRNAAILAALWSARTDHTPVRDRRLTLVL
jgi:hypothetical protein